MNKPVTIICGGIAVVGLLILSVCSFYALSYGSIEAGNFHRCVYWSERDPTTGNVVKHWDTNWERVEGTEAVPLANIDMWIFGLGFVVLGAALWIGERTTRRKGV